MIIKFLKITLITILIFVILDFLIGKNFYKKFIRKSFVDVDTSFLIQDNINDHKLIKNYKTNSAGWGKRRYTLCTDNNGFRSSCDNKYKGKKFDIGIIGDSFTEAVGIEYEDSYVGIISKELNNFKVANLAVSSYSPTIYYTKIKKLLKQNYNFNEIIIFLDLSDLHDDNVCYELKNTVVKKKDGISKCHYENYNIWEKMSLFSLRKLRLTYELFSLINSYLVSNNIKRKNIKNWVLNNPRSNWTFDYDKKQFNNLSREDALKISLSHMNNLHNMLKENNIELSVVIFPWPGTLKYDKKNNIHEKTWKEFCQKKCKKFYNLQEPFFKTLKTKNFRDLYFENYIDGDIHFNENGNKIIADNFLNLYLK